jgi:Rad and Gem related GTP binding protein 1
MVGIPGVSEKLSYKISFFYSLQVENSLSTYEPHACVVIYSVIAKSSFRVAEEILNYLWRENITRDKAVIIVGNKADLARSRVIATSGKL